MNFLRSAVSDVKLKYKVSRVCNEAVGAKVSRDAPCFAECVRLADLHAEVVLNYIRDSLSFSHPDSSKGAIHLLEFLVSSCNYSFHTALADHITLQERLLNFAIKRVTDNPHREVQRMTRLLLLEWSRTFAHDERLLKLSKLAGEFEKRTGKSLLRSINLKNKKVRFKEVTAQDIIPISPKERPGTMSGGVAPAPLAFTAEVWPCPACNYLNAPAAKKCAACDTVHVVTGTINGESSKSAKKKHVNKTNVGDTITLDDIEEYCRNESLRLDNDD